MTDVAIHVVGRTGAAGPTHAVLEDMVSMSPLTDVLGAAGSMRFGLHNLDPQAEAVHALEREVQVWRNGELVADGGWLVPIEPESTVKGSTDTVEFECRGLLWFFDRRHIGDADRRNYVLDGRFANADPEDEWDAVGTTLTRVLTPTVNGVASAKLEQAFAGTDTFLRQVVTITAGGVGAVMTLAAWFYVDPTSFVGEAMDKRGLFLQRSATGGGAVRQFTSAPLTNGYSGSVPVGVWQRRSVTVQIPADTTEDIEVRLYSPGGVIYWGEVVLVAMDSLSFYGVDQAAIADGLVVHLQDSAYGKSDLNIGRDTPATGIVRTVHYQHAQHGPGGRALAEYTELIDGFDQSIEVDGTNRTYTVHFPAKGTARADVTLDELVGVRWVPVAGQLAATSVTRLGEGDGPDREEGAAADPTAFGGLTLEEVLGTEPGITIDRLDALAAQDLVKRATAAEAEFTFGPGVRFGSMKTGDTFNGPAEAHGYHNPVGPWRAMSVAWDPTTDCLTVHAEAA